jgi:hypothetical protein
MSVRQRRLVDVISGHKQIMALPNPMSRAEVDFDRQAGRQTDHKVTNHEFSYGSFCTGTANPVRNNADRWTPMVFDYETRNDCRNSTVVTAAKQ